jgi:dipeptidyl aminopeptidase/acylaminoacyl peptidase
MRILALLRAIILALAGGLAAVTLAQAAPLEVYGRLPMIEEAAISPDGTMIAYALTDGDKRLVMVRRRADGEVLARIAAGETKVRDIGWAGTEYIIITSSQTQWVSDLRGSKREYLLATSFELATGQQRGLMDRAGQGAMNIVVSPPQIRIIDGRLTAIVEGVGFIERRGRIALFQVDLQSGKTRLLEPGYDDTIDWVVDAAGVPVAQTEYQSSDGRWRLRVRKGDGWPIVATRTALIGRPSLWGLGRDGASVVVSETAANGERVLREYPLDGGEPVQLPIKHFDGLIPDAVSRRLIGYYALVGDEHRYGFFDPRAEAVWKAITRAYAGDIVKLESWSNDRRKIVLSVDRKEAGPGYALIDLDAKSSEWLGDAYGGLKPVDVSAVTPVSYKAADGLTITGYLTLPNGKAATKLPLIVLPHGGPASRDEPGFDWWAQALASRGYAVLQPNFRGSDGLGESFLEAGYGEWGKKMQTDLSDGVRDLAAKGIIDPARVCIVGASYGGYAAMAGPTLDPGVYRCAVAVAGVSDLKRMLEAQAPGGASSEIVAVRYWSRFLGVDGRKDPDLAAISPATLAAKADAPMLLIHGKDDTVVLFTQSQIMYDALRRAGKPVELVTLKGEDHWLSRGDTRLQMLTAAVDFLEKHNPPD